MHLEVSVEGTSGEALLRHGHIQELACYLSHRQNPGTSFDSHINA